MTTLTLEDLKTLNSGLKEIIKHHKGAGKYDKFQMNLINSCAFGEFYHSTHKKPFGDYDTTFLKMFGFNNTSMVERDNTHKGVFKKAYSLFTTKHGDDFYEITVANWLKKAKKVRKQVKKEIKAIENETQ